MTRLAQIYVNTSEQDFFTSCLLRRSNEAIPVCRIITKTKDKFSDYCGQNAENKY